MIRVLILFSFVMLLARLQAQPTQTIRGSVVDHVSNTPVGFASVELLSQGKPINVTADSAGNFVFVNIPVGRYNIQATGAGYEPSLIRDVVVGSAKETFVLIGLEQKVARLGEVVVRSRINKDQPPHSMATVSARVLGVEQAKRFAGGFDDPARLASSFAGVASNTDVNGIIIRGNAPKFVQWKMEGVEIPTPNHFGDLKVFGGGTLTALSSQMLANSGFFTGAFPAEYNNALSGVFDIAMRNGNNQKKENTFQAGIIGIDASSEGPFKKGGQSSYLFNYRYSTLALLAPLLPENANSIKYQDLSFKLNFPTSKAGIFTVWGMALIDKAASKAVMDSLKWEYKKDRNEDDIKQYTLAVGASHFYFLKHNAYIKTTLAATGSKVDWNTQRLDSRLDLAPFSKIGNSNLNVVLSSFINKKFGSGFSNRTGITVTGMKYNLFLNNSITPGSLPVEIVNAKGYSTLVSAYTSSSLALGSRLKVNIGVNGQLFTLNNHYTVEPRLGIRRQINETQSIGVAYGLHSRLEQLNFYLNNSLQTGQKAVNKNLDFTKAHHFVLSYDWKINEFVRLKIEPYFQQLFNVPVIPDSSFSFLNLQGDWFLAEKMENRGVGRNYGVDITLEKYLSKGYYYLLTASVFNAEYRGGDNLWRRTRYNRSYVFNALFGKEWQTGKARQNVLSLNARATYQGGSRYSPVNEALSYAAKDILYDEKNAFSMQVTPSLNIHFTASYKINRKKTSREFALKILNLTNQSDFYGFKYNSRTNRIEKDLSSVIIPNLSYKIEF
ncbi:MAG TPA: carboxypeptidase-like regulatory domain-containing protein [Sediminibacterium sp.]|nr:carboxypeptidase-like regulatory domain-containing protein [Sediminibacterium sp.]